MEIVGGKPRQRTWKPKARSGCKTCKIRRVKCDEEKPHCKRCTSTGRTCDGYDVTFRFSRNPTSSPPETRPGPSRLEANWNSLRSQSSISLAPAIPLGTDEERESFDFFASHAVTKLRGFLDSPFWQCEVLQAAHREPAIRHCVVAMGAIYRRFYEGQHSHLTESAMSDKHLQFAFSQSNRAIKLLVDKPDSPLNLRDAKINKITLMTCAILFSSMCCLQGYQRQAIEHLRSGIRLLNEMDETGMQEENTADLDSLRTILVALDAQIRAIMPSPESHNWVAKPRAPQSGELLDNRSHGKLNMSTLLAVLQHMESLISHIHAFNQRTFLREPSEQHAQEQVALEQRHLVCRFEHSARVMRQLWDEAARGSRDDFVQSLTALELLQSQMEYLLRHPRADLLAKFPCLSAFQGVREPFEAPFDEAALFFRIFELCSRLLVGPENRAMPVFMTSMGPTAALWSVAMRAPASCQALRRRAAGLMLRHPRREGFWDGMVAGRIADEALTLEQERTRAELGVFDYDSMGDLEVPQHLRIVSFWLMYPEDEDRKVRVGFSDERDLAAGIPGAVRWFTW